MGKSSFLRAGVMPYLEEQCVGYRLLRRPTMAILIIQVAKDPVGQIAQGLLDATAEPLEYLTPDGDRSGSTSANRLTNSWGGLPITPRSARRWRVMPTCSRTCWPGWRPTTSRPRPAH